LEKRGRELTLANAEGYLRQVSALELLNRLPTAIIGVGPLGDIAYANPAFAEMLGYINATTVARLPLPSVLIGHEALTPSDCLRTLRTADSAVEWIHSQGYVIRTMVSSPLLVRETDTLLLIEVIDVTAWLWETNYRTDASRRYRLFAL
jgi:PAS domain-containing protein